MFKLLKKDSQPSSIQVNVSNRTVLRVIGLVFATIIIISLIGQAAHALLLIFVAFFLTLALNGPVQFFARHLPGKLRGSRSAGTSIIFLLGVLFIAGFTAVIVPPLIKQTQSFISSAPGLIQDARNQDSQLGGLIHKYRLENQLDNASSEISSRLQNIGSSAVSTLGKVGSSIFSTLTILVLTFMMLVEGPRALAFARELIPKAKRKNADKLGADMYRVVQGYVNGQVTLAAAAAVVLFPAMYFLHISYPIALMVLVFICGLIPMVGHTIGAIVVTLVALATSPFAAISILIYYFLYQQIENYGIQPRVQANSTNMSPLLVFISVVIGVTFGGLIGGLFAIPVAGCIRILLLDYLVNHDYISETDQPIIAETAEQAKA